MHEKLNEAQREAVLHTEGPLLILAGAGAGKTRVIVHRMAEIIRRGASPESVLAVTFTNKAAREMGERVRALVARERVFAGEGAHPFVGTFHALSLTIIRAFHTEAGLPKRSTIFDRSDSTRVLKAAIEAAGFDPKLLEPRRVLAAMSRAKGDAVSRETFLERATSYADESIAEVWDRHEAAFKKEHALDFDDILVTAHTLLGVSPIREQCRDRWRYLHIDEFQDTNRVQYEMMKRLAGNTPNVCAVGDADQNIYSWRGASLEHILNFEHDFPEARVILLTENYRSTKTIIQAANDAISKNTRRREKTLFTHNADGERIALVGLADETHEAAFVAAESAALIRSGIPPEAIAVLYRANFQSRILEEAFLGSGIPYQVLGTRFFERTEVKDALAYVRLVMNPRSGTDIARAIAAPARGIGKATVAKILAEAPLAGAAAHKVAAFFSLIERVRASALREPPSRTMERVITESGLKALYERGKGEDAERLENLKELVSVAAKYDALPPEEGLQKLLEEAALQSDQDELEEGERAKKPGVKLMTVHAAKGLEFPFVFITGLEAGLFPQERDEDGDSEEERRLFYVALTRAEKKVYASWAVSRRIFGTRIINAPSEFIAEMDSALCEVVAAPSWGGYDEPRDIIT